MKTAKLQTNTDHRIQKYIFQSVPSKKRCTTGELHIDPLLFILYYYDILEALFIPSK